MTARSSITCRRQDGTAFTLRGRDGWALAELVKAGAVGCTPLTHPGPRWSSYIHKLRHKHGLAVETVHESHGGPFAGHHARYVLREVLQVVAIGGDREAA